MRHTLVVRSFLQEKSLLVPYLDSLDAMRHYTRFREGDSSDQVWLLEHEPVYTLGQAASREHVLASASLPVIKTDRGGEVTYHGPGQIMIYFLADISRLKVSVRACVVKLEAVVIAVLKSLGVMAQGDRSAPGVYVDGAKIAALGLRFSRGKCYHGLCLNYDASIEPFSHINPCGYEGLAVTTMAEKCYSLPAKNELAVLLADAFVEGFDYQQLEFCEETNFNLEGA